MSTPIKSCRECVHSGPPTALWGCPGVAAEWAEREGIPNTEYDWPSQERPCPGYDLREPDPIADLPTLPDPLRAAFEAGYRMGYGNGYVDAEEGDAWNEEPGEAFDIWSVEGESE